MTVVMNIYYKEHNGDIVSYHEGGAVAPANETPQGCKLLALEGPVRITDEKTFRLNVRVDPITLNLLSINPPNILTPRPESAVNPISVNMDPNAELRDGRDIA